MGAEVSLLRRLIKVFPLILLLPACAIIHSESTPQIGLLAPFEGRYREVGYNALYAARLALQDAGQTKIELLPIDDGGSPASAADRAQVFASDKTVKAMLVLGYAASSEPVQAAAGDLPIIVVGSWSAQPSRETVFVLTNAENGQVTTAPPDIGVTDAAKLKAPVTGGDVFALEQFAKLRDSLEGITVVSSGSLPDSSFRDRYVHSANFAPEPGLLATLTYDAARLAIRALGDGTFSRAEVLRQIAVANYQGLNGVIRFQNGFWADAPIHYYGYNAESNLIPVAAPQSSTP
jgi:ABC-type branched-subunit amino acid transport system substrate-binding protein